MFHINRCIGDRREARTLCRKGKGKVMQTTTIILTWVAALTAATSLFIQSGLRK